MKLFVISYITSLSLSLSPTPVPPKPHALPPEGPTVPISQPVKVELLKPIEQPKIEEVAPVAPVEAVEPPPAAEPVVSASRGSNAGNGYDYGYCTWYVKNRRPDLPNNLGNAETWVIRAAAQGLATGYVPRAGAVGQLGNHVVYVEYVSGGLMAISEMNYQGWNIQSGRTISPAGWAFIY